MTHKQHAHIMVLLQWEISLARYNNLRVVKRPVWTPVCAKGLEDNSRQTTTPVREKEPLEMITVFTSSGVIDRIELDVLRSLAQTGH